MSDRAIIWDDSDRPLVVSSLVNFQMPKIKRLIGIGCPQAHLRLYSLVIRAHSKDNAQLVALFPLSLSGPA